MKARIRSAFPDIKDFSVKFDMKNEKFTILGLTDDQVRFVLEST
ncbi:MAG: hypothetical protein K0S09_28 [Sphingobacteriaceae bacterium]|jgi:hypothetical protein|nr:hypothetical protein [Sphingobacteriaceae bacterium]